MNKTCYKQYDTRWAKLLYPRKPWYIENCGCGEAAMCNSIIEMTLYKSQTPKTIQPYMKQYAEPNGNGTYHSGIPAAMKHYGLASVMEHATMPKFFAEMKKGSRVAILLMGSRNAGSKKVHWTGSGHFVACTGYKEKDGKHYLYIKDSASTSSLRNGWITYEDNIKGACLKVWTGKMPAKTGPEKVIAKAEELAWKKGTKKSKYAFSGGAPTKAFKTAFNKVFPKHTSWGKGPKTGASCDVAAATIIRASGLDKSMPRGGDEQIKHAASSKMQKIVKKNVKPYDVTKAGDMIIIIKNASASKKHVLIRGRNCLYEAQYQKTYLHVNSSMAKLKIKRPKVVIFRPK